MHNHVFLCFFLLDFMSASRIEITFPSSLAFPTCSNIVHTKLKPKHCFSNTNPHSLQNFSGVPSPLNYLEAFTPPPLLEDSLKVQEGGWETENPFYFHAEICRHRCNLVNTGLKSLSFFSFFFFLLSIKSPKP